MIAGESLRDPTVSVGANTMVDTLNPQPARLRHLIGKF